MEIIDIMNNYSLIIVISGLLSCILCGLIKVPIVKKIREYCLLKQLDSKTAASYIRNVCTLIVSILSVIFVASWYCITEGVKMLLDIKVYAEILGAFTASKLIYIFYEGAGKASIKKWIHSVLDKIKTKKFAPDNANKTDLSSIVQEYLTNNIHLPLTQEQITGLQDILTSFKNN